MSQSTSSSLDTLIARLSYTRNRAWALRLASVVTMLIIWEIWASRPDVLMMAPPSAVVGESFQLLFVNLRLTDAILAALRFTVVGYTIAVVVGLTVGFLIGFWEPARNVLNPILDAIYVTPLVALVPIIVIWFGISTGAKIFFVFVFAVFEIAINTEAGVTETPDGLVDAAKVFGAGPLDVYSRVHLRHAIPHIFTGLRLGGGRAVRGMVVAELFIAAAELGSFLVDTSSTFQIAAYFSGVAVLSALGVAVVMVVRVIEGRLLTWRHAGE